jgi:hypothetical protein
MSAISKTAISALSVPYFQLEMDPVAESERRIYSHDSQPIMRCYRNKAKINAEHDLHLTMRQALELIRDEEESESADEQLPTPAKQSKCWQHSTAML